MSLKEWIARPYFASDVPTRTVAYSLPFFSSTPTANEAFRPSCALSEYTSQRKPAIVISVQLASVPSVPHHSALGALECLQGSFPTRYSHA